MDLKNPAQRLVRLWFDLARGAHFPSLRSTWWKASPKDASPGGEGRPDHHVEGGGYQPPVRGDRSCRAVISPKSWG